MESASQKNKYLNRVLLIIAAGTIMILGLVGWYLVFSSSVDKAAAAPGAPASISISKIGKNSIRANWTPASDTTPQNAELVLNNIYTKRVYVEANIPGETRQYTFANISAGLYTAQICFDSTNCNSASSNGKEPISIFLSPTEKPNFKDISLISAESQKYINWIATYGIAKGYADGKYRPDKGVTREQMASFIYRSAGSPLVEDLTSSFTDLADNEHRIAVIWATSRNILQGYDCTDKHIPYPACTAAGTKIFQGKKIITRNQASLEIYRYAAFPTMSENDVKENLAKIKDAQNLTTDEEKTAVAWLLKEEIVSGYEDGNYRPLYDLTRSQMAKIMYRVSKLFSVTSFLKEEKGTNNFLNTSAARVSITSLKFIDTLPVCDSPIDVSYDDSGNILACVNGSQIIVGQAGGVIANPLSSRYLFYNLSNSAGVNLDLKYFDATYTKSTASMFAIANISNDLNLPAQFAKNASDMTNMFSSSTFKGSFSLSDDFGENADYLTSIFQSVNLPKSFKIPASLGKNASIIDVMFRNATINSPLVFSADFGKNATMVYTFFNDAIINADITFLGTFEKVTQSQLFYGAKINANLHFPENFLANCTGNSQMFGFSIIKGNIEFPKGFMANVSGGPYSFFIDAEISGDITFPADFGQNGKVAAYMFQGAMISGKLIFLEGFGTKSNMDMTSLFVNSTIKSNLVLPNNFGKSAVNMSYMFQNATLSANIDWAGADLTNSQATKTNMFDQVVWNNQFVLVQNAGSVTFLTTGTGGTTANIKVKGS
ncbi:MAG: S-layer homology domain-containing protein [Bifidobacteriaceae bacterium]|jgi:hypothetical protein|nr:S-layer homology domain-containing protein [Bifidobacteriaceae bacterium]